MLAPSSVILTGARLTPLCLSILRNTKISFNPPVALWATAVIFGDIGATVKQWPVCAARQADYAKRKPSNDQPSCPDDAAHSVRSGLTTQAQRPGARDATIATTTRPPGSLQRMVRPRVSHLHSRFLVCCSRQA